MVEEESWRTDRATGCYDAVAVGMVTTDCDRLRRDGVRAVRSETT